MMENRKCAQCGLVNFAGIAECARCGALIPRVAPAPAGVNPYERDGKKQFNPLPVLGLIAVVLVVGVVAYNVMSPAKPAAQASSPSQVQIDQKQSQAIQQAILESQKKDAERLAKMEEDMKNASEAINRKPDFTKLKAPECKMTGSSLNPSTGTMTPNYSCN